MSLEVIVELINKLTGPAKQVKGDLQNVGSALQAAEKQAEKMSGGAAKLQRDFLQVAGAASKVESAAGTVASGMGRTVSATERAEKAMGNTARSAKALARSLAELEHGPRGNVDGFIRQQERLTRALREQGAVERRAAALRREAIAAPPLPPERRGIGRAIVDNAGSAIGIGLGYAGIHEAGQIVERTIGAGVEAQHTAVTAETGGISPAEWAEIQRTATDLSARFKQFSRTDIEKMAQDARVITGHNEEGLATLPDMLRLRTLVQAQHPETDEHVFGGLLKGLEIANVTQNPAKFHDYMEGIARTINTFKDTISVGAYQDFFQYAGGQAAQKLDLDYITGPGATVLSEMKAGSTAGLAQRAFYNEVVGGRMSGKAAEAWDKLGLLDESKVKRNSKGEISRVMPGAVIGGDLGARNPSEFLRQRVLPALDAKGISGQQRDEFLTAMFENANAQRLASILATQQAKIDKDTALSRQSPGLDAAETFSTKDTSTAWKNLTGQLENLFRLGADPLMGKVPGLLNSIAAGLSALGQAADKVPGTATVGVAATATGLGAGGAALGGWFAGLFGKEGLAAGLGRSASVLFRASEIGMLLTGLGLIRAAADADDPNARLGSPVSTAPEEWDGKGQIPDSLWERAHRQDLQFRANKEVPRSGPFGNLSGGSGNGDSGAAAPAAGPQTIDNSKHITAPITVNAPVSITVQSPATPGAIGSAVGGAIGAGVAKGAAALHDGPEAQ